MALTAFTLDVLKGTLDGISQTGCASRKICALGYPDILANPDQLRTIFGEYVTSRLQYRADSAEILRWHGAQRLTDRVADASSLFSLLGYGLEVVDIVPARGNEILLDLNEPLPAQLKERYAAAIDAGTVEHCFNIAQAVKNIAELVAVGGAVIHANPINMFNHGFYNLNPTWYHDFYEENGYVVEYLRVVNDPVFAPKVSEVPAFERFRGIPENSSLLVVARRAELAPVRWPVQRKYRATQTPSDASPIGEEQHTGRGLEISGAPAEAADQCIALLRSGHPDRATAYLAAARKSLVRRELSIKGAMVFAHRVLEAHFELLGFSPPSTPAGSASMLWNGGLGADVFALLLDYLQCCSLANEAFERILTDLRRRLLEANPVLAADSDRTSMLELASALAVHAFRSEFVFAEEPGEAEAIACLEAEISASLAANESIRPYALAIYGAYRPLHRLTHAERIPLLANAMAGSHFASLIKVQVVEPIAEIALLPRIRTLTPIADRTSQAVRDQYEENPYPRWHRLPGGMPQNGLASGGPAIAAGAARLGAPRERTLIAGCGTGQHPVSVALKNPDSDFLAIDLSRSSLAYAQRMASEYGVRNVEFAQADLLGLPETGLSFDTISCVGVLHHLGRPVEGLHALRRLMAHERGLKVAVYTESGRQGVVAAIRLREKFALPGTANGIRSLRQMIWKLAANDSAREVAMTADFYSLSGCRDLVFHVMEHRYTIPAFAELVESAGLRIETVLAPAAVLARFDARFPEAGSRTDVTRWDQFEIDNPGVFGSMYRFMLAKRSP